MTHFSAATTGCLFKSAPTPLCRAFASTKIPGNVEKCQETIDMLFKKFNNMLTDLDIDKTMLNIFILEVEVIPK